MRPTLLITDAKNVFVSHKPRKERDKQLIGEDCCFYEFFLSLKRTIILSNKDSIMSTLKAGGNVLLPIDTAGRVLGNFFYNYHFFIICKHHSCQTSTNRIIISVGRALELLSTATVRPGAVQLCRFECCRICQKSIGMVGRRDIETVCCYLVVFSIVVV